MQVTLFALRDGHHTSLLTHLDLQRGQGQFCDCVLRQRQNSDQIYPAHRCVLAASSPVLASILLSAGALVELQDPCLSDAVLASLLDYIYSGVLPRSLSQQQHLRLLTAARHLQMKELQEALRAARTRDATEGYGAEVPPFRGNTDQKTFSDLPSSPIQERFRRLGTKTKYLPEVATFEEAQTNPTSFNSNKKDNKGGVHEPNHHIRADADALNSFCVIESSGRVNTSGGSYVLYSNQPSLMLNNPGSTEVRDVPGGNQEEHSDGFVKVKAEEEPLGTSTLKRSSCATSPQCYRAVPVICHSRAAAPVSSSTDRDRTSTAHRDQDGGPTQDTRSNRNHSAGTTYPELKDTHNSSATDGLTNTDRTDGNRRHPLRDAPQSNNSLVLQHKDWSKGLKRQTESDLNHFVSKHQRFNCSECHDEALKTAKEEPAPGLRSEVSLPAQDSEAGRGFLRERRLDVEAKQEHIFSIRLLPGTDTEDRDCQPHRNTNRVASIRYESSCTSTSSESGLEDTFASERCTSSESREISSLKTTESCLSPMTPAGTCMSDPTRETTGQPHHGHPHYQNLPHPDTHSLIQGSNYKYSWHSRACSSDDSSGEEEAGSFAMKQRISTEETHQVLLTDVNSKPAELPCKHKPDPEETRVMKSSKESSASRAEGLDETHKQRNDAERNSSDEDRRGSEAQAAQTPAVTEASEATAWPVCPTPAGTDSEKTSLPSAVSACAPSSLVASMPGERSAPCHQPFQCSLCDRSFSQRGSLNRHVRSHLGVRPFPCPRCPMTFSRQYRVTEHMRVHQRCTLGNGFQRPGGSSSEDDEDTSFEIKGQQRTSCL